jgi:hypothetical protein
VKEIITEQQADWIVMGLAILVTLISLGWGFYQSHLKTGRTPQAIWAEAVLFAVTGPAIWIFWGVYNSIENFYGLDSVKALEINFGIVMGIAVLFVAIHWLIGHFMPRTVAKRHR